MFLFLHCEIPLAKLLTSKVFTNYRNFGAMYQSKNNFKKAEWAFKNGIKQAVSCFFSSLSLDIMAKVVTESKVKVGNMMTHHSVATGT